ncbi:hypothetical protein WA026_000884 [Henosepilachna vigintioctopunctata]|uniref:Guided entry of tail-anchored proteins factor 1 n=1 Tax=Henosepilachna vigintioctopunctata TaxID=420089 RepID=A0AAW1V1X1_9CUCU
MLLLLSSTLLSFLSVHPKIVSEPVLKLIKRSSTGDNSELKEIRKLKSEQQKLNIVDNFAEYSRIQRKINILTQSIEEKNAKSANNLYITISLSRGLQIFLIVLLVILSLYFRRTPVFYLDDSIDITPFGHFISFPNAANSVSFHFWVMCCRAVAKLTKSI